MGELTVQLEEANERHKQALDNSEKTKSENMAKIISLRESLVEKHIKDVYSDTIKLLEKNTGIKSRRIHISKLSRSMSMMMSGDPGDQIIIFPTESEFKYSFRHSDEKRGDFFSDLEEMLYDDYYDKYDSDRSGYSTPSKPSWLRLRRVVKSWRDLIELILIKLGLQKKSENKFGISKTFNKFVLIK